MYFYLGGGEGGEGGICNKNYSGIGAATKLTAVILFLLSRTLVLEIFSLIF